MTLVFVLLLFMSRLFLFLTSSKGIFKLCCVDAKAACVTINDNHPSLINCLFSHSTGGPTGQPINER
jgi:hypothetical protein